MNEYAEQVKRLVVVIASIIAMALVSWFMFPPKKLIAGIVLGLLIAIVNAVYSAIKIHKLGTVAVTGQGRPTLGWATRLSLGAIGALIVIKYPEYFDVIGLAIGLLFVPVFALGDAIYYQLKKNH